MTLYYSSPEIREFVAEYQRQPHGTKEAWLQRQPVTRHQLDRWRRMVYAGDVDKDLVPRDARRMKYSGEQLSEFEKQRQAEITAHEAEVSKLQARIAQLEGTNDALGKAIGLLHQLNEQESAPTTTSEPKPSSPRRTDSSSS